MITSTETRSAFSKTTPILSATGVTKAYDGRTVLAGISLELRRGERLALTGPSGSGKTTLLNCLGGIDRHDGGSIEFLGARLEHLDGAGLARLRRQNIGTVFQFFHLLPTLSAAENVELPLQLVGAPPKTRAEKVRGLLERVGLAARAEALPGQLSGGEMQRVAIARALVHEPELLLADEPTGNLDSVTGKEILAEFQRLNREHHQTIILVTHDPSIAAVAPRLVTVK
ncbi:MAG: ABC transporter ATP-binding protein, partial [Opitutaceae bacterium]